LVIGQLSGHFIGELVHRGFNQGAILAKEFEIGCQNLGARVSLGDSGCNDCLA
jgi:hypothetical protein